MDRYPHLKNAPIAEAIIDLRVDLPSDVDINRLKDIHNEIDQEYPGSKNRYRLESHIIFEKDKSIRMIEDKNQPDGVFFYSSDQFNVFQARLDGFTFSRVKQYINWDYLYQESRKLWEVYAKFTKPLRVSRIATRFINRLDLPSNLRDFSDYLTVSPQPPPRLPQTMLNFHSRVVTRAPESEAIVIINQALEKIDKTDGIQVILDIDVFQELDDSSNFGEAWKFLDRLRDVKNQYFFESITHAFLRNYM